MRTAIANHELLPEGFFCKEGSCERRIFCVGYAAYNTLRRTRSNFALP
jgi:hypothetical protein